MSIKKGCFLLLLCCSLCLPDIIFAQIYGKSICKTNGYHCLRIRSYRQSWESLWPDAYDRSIMMRLNRMNIALYPGLVLAVPDNLKTSSIMDFSPFPREITPPQEKLLIFDPRQLAWGAYNADGKLIRWGPASGGADWCKDIEDSCRTDEGSFRIFSLGSSECVSTKFPLPEGGAPMPYCMYFNNGQAFHGSPTGLAGYNASHSCVRMYVNDAEWLRYDFAEAPTAYNHYRGTKVIIKAYDSSIYDDSSVETIE